MRSGNTRKDSTGTSKHLFSVLLWVITEFNSFMPTIDLTKPIGVFLFRTGAKDFDTKGAEVTYAVALPQFGPMAMQAHFPEAEAYRRFFEAAPKMLALLKKSADELAGWLDEFEGYDADGTCSVADQTEDRAFVTGVRGLLAEIEGDAEAGSWKRGMPSTVLVEDSRITGFRESQNPKYGEHLDGGANAS